MLGVNVETLELIPMWNDVDPAARARFYFPLHAAVGTQASAVVYFEVEPGEYLATHRDSAEEILLVLEGEGVAWVGDEEMSVGVGSLAVVPALEPHGVRNTGDGVLRAVGFFAAAELEHDFEDPIQPIGTSHVTTPPAVVPA